jgi:CRP-like cAMP-binding protein
MDLNLILSAQTLCLPPQFQLSKRINGLLVVKNVLAKTYLRVTPEQWMILKQFEKPRTVPAVLGEAIQERQCLPLGEFFELILKALRAHVLLEPGVEPVPVMAYDWHWIVRPQLLARALIFVFGVGLVMTLAFRPQLPATLLAALAGLVLLSAALSAGAFLAACMVRGASGEVYRPHWQWRALPPCFTADRADAVMLPQEAQVVIGLAQPTVLAALAGILSWDRPEWALFPMLGLILTLRPIFGGRITALIYIGRKRGPSDAEHDFVFPFNLRPKARGQLLKRALRQSTTWVRLVYGVIWSLVIVYWGARLTDTPPWSLTFWEINGVRIALAIGLSLLALGVGYAGWEFFHFARERARARRNTLRQLHARWLGARKLVLDEPSRAKAVASSPLFASLPLLARRELSQAMAGTRHGPWQSLAEYSKVPTHVALIVSGKVSVRRELSTSRTVEVQVLSEGDVIGLHDLADPKQPDYSLRSLTPVTLLTVDRGTAEEIIVSRITPVMLTDMLLKMPFLRRISLCQNWHLQAIERFARLSIITDYPVGGSIFIEGQSVQDFFIIFQGDARVTRKSRRLALIHAGGFFGEIGLMQNSTPNATITAHRATRCLSITRQEFLRFVTHNHTVALELEQVSSERLGRPLFPLQHGDFRMT